MKQDWNTGLINDVYLERFILGELTEIETRALEARLAMDPSLGQRLEAIKAHNPVFEARYPAEEMVSEIEAAVKAAQPHRRSPRSVQEDTWLRRLTGAFQLSRGWQIAGAFALLLLSTLPVVMLMKPVGLDEVRLKGKEAELRLYRNAPGGPERVVPGASAAAGDVFQVEFHPGEFSHGAIVSVDGNGGVTLHWPTRPDAGTAWSSASGYRLPEAFQLDRAPRFERFHLVLSKEPIDLDKLISRVAASTDKDENWLSAQFPESVRVITSTLKKEP